jgi:serine kinase of HPr protein (carbohydrate metabolism regulator)
MNAVIDVHGTCVAVPAGDHLCGVLLRGAPGSGKSDLALRLIDWSAKLVSDDLVRLSGENGRCIARAPKTIRGRMEVRGLGIVYVDSVDAATLGLVVDLAAATQIPRLPEPCFEELAGVHLPRLILNPFEISAGAKIRVAVQALVEGAQAGVTFPFAR